MVVTRTVVLGERRDEDGTWWRAVSIEASGDLVIAGHDSGRGVERMWGDGMDEYEFTRTVRAADVPAAAHALGITEPSRLLDVLVDRYAGRGTHELEALLQGAGVASEIWTRVG